MEKFQVILRNRKDDAEIFARFERALARTKANRAELVRCFMKHYADVVLERHASDCARAADRVIEETCRE